MKDDETGQPQSLRLLSDLQSYVRDMWWNDLALIDQFQEELMNNSGMN